MKDASSTVEKTNLSEPLLSMSEDHDTDVTKIQKPASQLQVHRFISFVIGTVTGICLQAVSVLFFAKLIMFAHSNGQNILQKTTDMQDGTNHYELLLQSSNSTWLKVAIWTIYHMSLFIYLAIWLTMMLLAMSKAGWKCVSTGLRIPHSVTRRTCFLRTFFFINGKSQYHHHSRVKSVQAIHVVLTNRFTFSPQDLCKEVCCLGCF